MSGAGDDVYRQYQEQTRRLRALLWWSGFGGSIGLGLAVGFAWSFAVGIPLALVLVSIWLPLFLRIVKAMQIKRFPELAGENAVWTRRYHA